MQYAIPIPGLNKQAVLLSVGSEFESIIGLDPVTYTYSNIRNGYINVGVLIRKETNTYSYGIVMCVSNGWRPVISTIKQGESNALHIAAKEATLYPTPYRALLAANLITFESLQIYEGNVISFPLTSTEAVP